MKIKLAEKRSYEEIAQTSQTRFSFVSKIGEDEYIELFSPVKCRDFLGDAVYANHYKKKVLIYGFLFDGSKQQLDGDATRLLIHFGESFELERFKEISGKFEKEFNLSFQYLDNLVLVTADRVWQSSVWTISLFSFLLRAMCYGKENLQELANLEGIDSRYMKEVSKNWKKLLTHVHKIKACSDSITGYPNEENLPNYQLHGSSGFVSLFRDKVVGFVKENVYWKEFQNV